MIDQVFCQFLEHAICEAFDHSNNEATRGFWCDGVVTAGTESGHFQIQNSVNSSRRVVLTAFIGKDGQAVYALVLKFGDKALSRYSRNLDLKACVPDPKKPGWFEIDTERNCITIQLD